MSSWKVEYFDLDGCRALQGGRAAGGAVVVIDVLRAFSCAAYAFAGGAQAIAPVATVTEALALRAALGDMTLAMGEVSGARVPEFDLGNSPADILATDVCGRRLVQRTSAGTQGLVRCSGAGVLLAASFVCAAATARYLAHSGLHQIAFVITGADDHRDGDEDAACADYIAALLQDGRADPQPYLQRAMTSDVGRWFADRAEMRPDLELCLAVDRIQTAMPVRLVHDRLWMTPVEMGYN